MATTPAPQRRPLRLLVWLVLVGALVALAYLGAGEEPPDDVAYRYGYSISAAISYAVIVIVMLVVATLAGGLRVRDAFALRRPASWRRALGLTALALIAIWVVGAVLSPILDADEEQGLLPDEWDSTRAGAFALFFVLVAFVAPVVEELTYRGVGYALMAPYGTWVAILGTGVLFGLAHGLVVALPVLTFFGFAIGWLRMRTESIYPPVLLHATFNGIALAISVTVSS
jgi:membrane protease YdiL (CAAX protease family)